MTLKISLISFLLSSMSILIIVQHTECHVQPHANRTVTAFFDLSRVQSMSDAELKHNYQSIVLSMRREGRSVLKYFKSDMLRVIFANPHNEAEAVILERWYEVCDFYLENEDVEHLKTYIFSEDDTVIDGTKVQTAGADLGQM